MARGAHDARTLAGKVVVVTVGGSALGNDVASTWEGMLAGRSGIATIAAFELDMMWLRKTCRNTGGNAAM